MAQRDLLVGADDGGAEVKAAPSGKSVVVAVGINAYDRWPRLDNAVSDALGVRRALVDELGFRAPIEPLLDGAATREAILALAADRLRSVLGGDDSLVFFFAGHGHTRLDTIGSSTIETGFLVPVGAGTGVEERWSDYIEIDSFLQTLALLPARHVLVILDACYSGVALGSNVKRHRDAVRYERDLGGRVSRKVVTSARRDQRALDAGPLAGHSLFAGTLIEGLTRGFADLDGNGVVTSSELGLFLQQRVGQASGSAQTPDFGEFHHDSRGEMLIALRPRNFEAVWTRAFASLQQGDDARVDELIEDLAALRASSAEAVYLRYRRALASCDAGSAMQALQDLSRVDTGMIPLSGYDLRTLKAQLDRWKDLLAIPAAPSPLLVSVIAEDDAGGSFDMRPAWESKTTYDIDGDATPRLVIENPHDQPYHLYLIEIDPDGRVTPLPLWDDKEVKRDSLLPKETRRSYAFRPIDTIGLYEHRLLVSRGPIHDLVARPYPRSWEGRGWGSDTADERGIWMTPFRYRVTAPLPRQEPPARTTSVLGAAQLPPGVRWARSRATWPAAHIRRVHVRAGPGSSDLAHMIHLELLRAERWHGTALLQLANLDEAPDYHVCAANHLGDALDIVDASGAPPFGVRQTLTTAAGGIAERLVRRLLSLAVFDFLRQLGSVAALDPSVPLIEQLGPPYGAPPWRNKFKMAVLGRMHAVSVPFKPTPLAPGTLANLAMKQGDWLVLRVENMSTEPLHLTALRLAGDGSIGALGRYGGEIAPRSALEDIWRESSIAPGRCMIKVFATTSKADSSRKRDKPLIIHRAPLFLEDFEATERQIELLLEPPGRRVASSWVNGWVTRQVEIEITRAR
ncbi:caspase family protein [Sorangium sp. So ce1078]|uniref:caspase family protein n=1 Tax=Sorangium sp. So ce1078 TaxID=3133329 RepID=UPI003F604363